MAFCKKHLPDKDTTITLEDESGKEYKTKYIACKTGLSAGWRQFSAVHKLQEGDVVVFQLVEPTKFKVMVWIFIYLFWFKCLLLVLNLMVILYFSDSMRTVLPKKKKKGNSEHVYH